MRAALAAVGVLLAAAWVVAGFLISRAAGVSSLLALILAGDRVVHHHRD